MAHDRTKKTHRHLKDMLPSVLHAIDSRRKERPDKILAGWDQIIEVKWRSMAKAISFEKGVLMVKVKNAALHSLLVQQEKPRLLQKLQEMFPEAALKNIIFRIG